jgi:hypothetical protein
MHFPCDVKGKQKSQYDEETLIGWNVYIAFLAKVLQTNFIYFN